MTNGIKKAFLQNNFIQVSVYTNIAMVELWHAHLTIKNTLVISYWVSENSSILHKNSNVGALKTASRGMAPLDHGARPLTICKLHARIGLYWSVLACIVYIGETITA